MSSNPGTKSDIFTDILFNPTIALFIKLITAFKGDLITEANPLTIPLNILTSPCYPLYHFPVNTPAIKSIIPLKISFILGIFFIFTKNPFNTSLNKLIFETNL